MFDRFRRWIRVLIDILSGRDAQGLVVWVVDRKDGSPVVCDLAGPDSTVCTDQDGRSLVPGWWLRKEILVTDPDTDKCIGRHVLVKTPGQDSCKIVVERPASVSEVTLEPLAPPNALPDDAQDTRYLDMKEERSDEPV